MNRSLRALGLLLLCSFAAVGCAAESTGNAEADETAGAEDDFTAAPAKSKLLGEVAAVKAHDATIGSKKKVTAVLRALGLGATNAIPQEGAYRCMPGYRMELLGPKGNVVGNVGLMCGGSTKEGVHAGTVSVNGKSYLIQGDVTAIEAQLSAPLAASDVLWGTSSVSLRNRSGSQQTDDAKLVVDVLNGVGDALKEIPPGTPEPRCMPARSLSFKRGTVDIGSISSSCGEDVGTGPGKLRVGDKSFELTLNLTKIAAVEAALGMRN